MCKKIIVLSLAVFFMASGFGDAGEKVLTVGVSGTYTGGFAAVGKHVSDGIADYLNWTANRGGIEFRDPASGKNGKAPIKVLVEDNQYKAVKAAMAYKRFKDRGANVIIGFGSTPGEACSASASQDKLPYLSWYSYASPAGYRPTPQYYWAFLPTIAESATPMIKWFVTKKWQGSGTPRVGIIALNVPSWQILGKPGMMDAYIKSLGGQLAGIEFISLKATDLSQPITRLVFKKKADCLVLIGALSQTVFLARNMQRLRINPEKTVVICNISAWDESLFKSAPRALEGFYGEVYTVSPSEKNVPGIKKMRDVAKQAGRDPEKIVANYINGYVGSLVLETAIRRALEKNGHDAVVKSGEMIRNELHSFKDFDPLGLTPTIGVRHPDEPFFLNYARMVRAKNGKFEDAGDWISIDRIKGTLE